jgi:hypothetical protein
LVRHYQRHTLEVGTTHMLIQSAVVALMAAYVDNKPITPAGAHVEKILPLLPTIFPIAFAAIMGKLFKHFALYRAERGVRLMVGSQICSCPYFSRGKVLTTTQGTRKASWLPVSIRSNRETNRNQKTGHLGTSHSVTLGSFSCWRSSRSTNSPQVTAGRSFQHHTTISTY